MSHKGIVIFAPSPFSLIATSVCELLVREGVQVDAIVIRKFTLKRFRQEFKRDGNRLIRKIWNKLVLREKGYKENAAPDNIVVFRKHNDIQLKSLLELKKNSVRILQVDDLNDEKVVSLLSDLKPGLVLFTGGGLLRKEVLRRSGKGVLNCHMGILPEYKGMDVVEWPLLLNDKGNLGVTVHYMDEGVDTGDIISKEYIRPVKGETIRQLRQRYEPVMVKQMVRATLDVLGDKVQAQQQPLTGHQYFIMHPRLIGIAADNLKKD